MDMEHYTYDENSKKYSLSRLEKGDRCVLAIHNNKIVGYLWSMRDTMEINQFKHIPLAKDRSSSYKGFVLKEYRGSRIQAAMYDFLIDILKNDGKRFVVSVVDFDNKPSIRTKQRGGYKTVGQIVHISFFGLRYDAINKKTLSYLQNS